MVKAIVHWNRRFKSVTHAQVRIYERKKRREFSGRPEGSPAFHIPQLREGKSAYFSETAACGEAARRPDAGQRRRDSPKGPLFFQTSGGFSPPYPGWKIRSPQLKEINGLFAFLLHFADKTVVDFNLLGAGVAFVFYGFMDDNLLDQGIQQFGSQF